MGITVGGGEVGGHKNVVVRTGKKKKTQQKKRERKGRGEVRKDRGQPRNRQSKKTKVHRETLKFDNRGNGNKGPHRGWGPVVMRGGDLHLVERGSVSHTTHSGG